MQVERIKFERTGGFAGMTMARDLKVEDLPEEHARQLAELLDGLDFEELPARLAETAAIPDEFIYTITIETPEGEHTVTTGEASAPEEMQELLKLLNRLARLRKKR